MEQKWTSRFRLGYQIMATAAMLVFCSLIQSLLTNDVMLSQCIGAACASIVCLTLGLLMRDIYHQNPADSHSLRSVLLQYLLQRIVLIKGARVVREFQTAGKDVTSAQYKTLMNILQKASDTEYGRRYGFKNIKTREEFVSKVPLSTYDNYEPYVNRLISDKRECNSKLLTKDSVDFFAMTSGTTGKNKLFPLTKRMQELIVSRIRPLTFYNDHIRTSFSLGRVLLITYAYNKQYSASGVPIAPVSSYTQWIYPYVVTPLKVCHFTDELVALHLHAVFGLMDPHVERIESLFSSLMYTFWKHIECHWREICDEIETGALNIKFQNKSLVDLVGKDSAETIESELKRRSNPRRAAELRREFSEGFTNIARRIWPQLRGARMKNTGSSFHYSESLRETYLGGVTQVSGHHAATEGFLGINLPSNCERQHTPLIQIGFYEFIPEENITDEKPRTLFVHELEAGGVYEIVYTSPVGLYRYRIGDVIRVVSKMDECPVYQFEYRTGEILNVRGEKLPESVLYRSIQEVMNILTAVQLVDYTTTESLFVPQLFETFTKCYVFFLELSREGGEVTLKEEEKLLFDEILRRNFERHDSCRKDSLIGPVHVVQVRGGTFTKLKRLHFGGAQYKIPRVTRKQADIELLISNILQADL